VGSQGGELRLELLDVRLEGRYAGLCLLLQLSAKRSLFGRERVSRDDFVCFATPIIYLLEIFFEGGLRERGKEG